MNRRDFLAAVMIAIAAILAAGPAAAAGAKVAPKSGAAMCVLTAADFAALGIEVLPRPAPNVSDAGASVYCAYSKNSGAFGGVELDVFNPAGATIGDAREALKVATSESHPAPTPIAVAGADEALWSPNAASGGVSFGLLAFRRGMLVVVLSIPANKDVKTQLTRLAALVLERL